MNFRQLVKQLGVPRPNIGVADKYNYCKLPFLPFDRIRRFEGCEIKSNIAPILFEIPLDDGIARLTGDLRIQSDGSQTFVNAIAIHISSP